MVKIAAPLLALAAATAPISLAWTPAGSSTRRATLSSAFADDAGSRRDFFGSSAAAALVIAGASPAHAKGPKAGVSFANIKDGDTVPPTFTYKFDVTGYELSPAAAGLKEGTGHHHLVIDGPKSYVDAGVAIPFDDTHKHYGKAQTEGELTLAPGRHTLTLQFANADHESYGRGMAKTITVNVKDT